MKKNVISTHSTEGSILPHVRIKLLNEDAQVPQKAYIDDAAYDLFACTDAVVKYGTTADIATGISIEMPRGYYATVEARSGMGKAGLSVHRGIIDTGYRGEISVFIHNTSTSSAVKQTYEIKKGDRIAQLIFHSSEPVIFDEVEELSKSERDTKGHGSTGR